MSNDNSTSHATMPLIAAGATVLALIGAVALIALDILAEARGRHIENVSQPPLTRTLVAAGLLVIALAWAMWLAKRFGIRHGLTLVATGFTVVLLVATPVIAWRAFTSDRDLTVTSMTCNAEILKNIGVAPLTDCTEGAVETIVLLEGVKSDEIWVPDSSTGNLTREFTNLPGGNWDAKLTVDGPEDTVAVVAVADRDGTQEKLGSLRPHLDAESGRMRWSATVPIDGSVSNVRVLFYQSQNPEIGSASLRFDVKQCAGQNVRSFDAARCEPFEGQGSFVMEAPPEENRTWRQPLVTREGPSLVVSNLEARTYELIPDYSTIQMYTQSTDVLIIPSAMEQVEENSITAPGEAPFPVKIEENTGELIYTIYVFPTGPTYASAHP